MSCDGLFLSIRSRCIGLLGAGAAVASLSTLLGFLGAYAWWLDLFSHFRVQYMAGLFVAAVFLFLLKCRRSAGVYAVFFLINLAVVWGRLCPSFSSVSATGEVYRVMLLNVNTGSGDPELVGKVVEEADSDLVVLEEVDAYWMLAMSWMEEVYPYSVKAARDDNFGIALFSKVPLRSSKVVRIGGADVPTIIAEVVLGEEVLSVVATHPLPPTGGAYTRFRNEQLDLLPAFFPAHGPLMLIGDLNVTPWSGTFRALLKKSGLRDSGCGFGLQTTWPDRPAVLRIPLDHCLVSDEVVVLDREVGPYAGSDHFPLIVDFYVVQSVDRFGK